MAIGRALRLSPLLLAAGCAAAPQLPSPAPATQIPIDSAGARVTAIADEFLVQALARSPEIETWVGQRR